MCMWLCLSFCIAWCLPFPHNQQRLLQTVALELITETITEPPRLTLPPRRSTAFQYSFGSPTPLLEVSILVEYIAERPKCDGNIFARKKNPCHRVERYHVINNTPRVSFHPTLYLALFPVYSSPALKQTSCLLYTTSSQSRS